MKKLTILSIVAAAILLGGCGDKGKEATAEAAAKATESTKTAAEQTVDTAKEATDKAADAVKSAAKSISEATEKAVEATRKAASDVTDSAKEVVEDTKSAASDAVDSAKESVAAAATSVATAVTAITESAAGAEVYKKCTGCHGADGQTKALGKSAVIAGESKDDLVTKISEYKAGTRDVAGMGNLMKGQVASLSDEDIQAVAQYISTLK